MESSGSRMRTLMLCLPKQKPEMLRKKESALKGSRKKGETSAEKSGLLILTSRTMKA